VVASARKTLGAGSTTTGPGGYTPRKKKTAPPNGALTALEGAEARAALRDVQTFLLGVRDNLDDPPSAKQRKTLAELREQVTMVRAWVQEIDGGPNAARNRRWALVYELTADARRQSGTPTATDVAAWPLLPLAYAASSRATALLARSVVAKKRDGWLALVAEAVLAVDGIDVNAASFETMVRKYQKAERRMLLVDAD